MLKNLANLCKCLKKKSHPTEEIKVKERISTNQIKEITPTEKYSQNLYSESTYNTGKTFKSTNTLVNIRDSNKTVSPIQNKQIIIIELGNESNDKIDNQQNIIDINNILNKESNKNITNNINQIKLENENVFKLDSSDINNYYPTTKQNFFPETDDNINNNLDSLDNFNTNKIDEYDRIIVPDNYIREEEKDFIIWSKNGIVDFYNRINNSEYIDLKTSIKNLNVKVKKNGSVLNKNLSVVNGVYKISKNEFIEGITLEYLIKFIYDPVERMKWDDGYKEIRKIEGNEEVYVVKSWMKAPVFLVSQRDAIDKRIEFFKNGIYYNFCSSVDEKFVPEEKGTVRCKNYFNILTIEQDEENYYFRAISQTDIKMSVPQTLVNMSVPGKMLSWYKMFIKSANKIYLETNKRRS